MRGLDDALARIARRNELLERANAVRSGPHPPILPAPQADPAPPVQTPVQTPVQASPAVSRVVAEVAEALEAVVERNPGVFATVVVQEADTAWSVWIGDWDGTLRTRVSRLEPDPADQNDASEPTPVPRAAVGPAMNDREPSRIAELLRREAAR
jgi:hypothetical protein